MMSRLRIDVGRLLRETGMFAAVMLLLMHTASADVVNNVTFTVKSNGTVVATSNHGQFDAAGKVLTIDEAAMPADFHRTTGTSTSYGRNPVYLRIDNGVGRKFSGKHQDFGSHQTFGTSIDASVRVSFMQMRLMSQADLKLTPGRCDAGSDLGLALWSSDGQPPYTGSVCGSTEMSNHDNMSWWEDYEFWMQRMVFNFFEDEGGASTALNRLKLPPGTYIFPSQNFIVTKPLPGKPWQWMSKNWTINMSIIVEPSMAEVNMPSIMDMTVRDIGNNRLTGEGDVFISVQGTLGRSLRVKVLSANSGQLRHSRVGVNSVRYSLSLSELAGDFHHFKLIDDGQLRPEVNIPLIYGVGFEHPLRLNASFNVSKTGLDSGYYSDNVTLIFSTSDVP